MLHGHEFLRDMPIGNSVNSNYETGNDWIV